ncbi:FCH domain only [Branchiostoma belcheri]|nr:FCH domain only [Branchiostoma belcheri]
MPARKKRKTPRHDCRFKPGQKPWNKGCKIDWVYRPHATSYLRPTQDEERLYLNRDRKGNIVHNDVKTLNEAGTLMVLRPRKLPVSRGPSKKRMPKKARKRPAQTRRTTNPRVSRSQQGVKEETDQMEEYRIWSDKRATEVLDGSIKAQREHDQGQPACRGLLRLATRRERREGLDDNNTQETLVCDDCNYSTTV